MYCDFLKEKSTDGGFRVSILPSAPTKVNFSFLMFKGQNNASININWGRVSYSRILLIRQYNIEVALSEFIIKVSKMSLDFSKFVFGDSDNV